MKTRTSHALIFVTGLLSTLFAAAAASAAPATPANDTSLARQQPTLQRALDKVVASGAPGATLLVHDGKRTLRLSSGYGNLETQTPISTADRFRAGSVTKSYIAALTLQLVDDRKLRLSDTVDRWLPGLVPNGENITILQLLGHRSGLPEFFGDPIVNQPYYDGDFDYHWDPRDLIAIATSHPPVFTPPGTSFSYTNTGYVVLGLVAEAATRHPIDAELSRRIFKPLGLSMTSFASSSQLVGSPTHGYLDLGQPTLVDTTYLNPFAWTAGAVISTLDDTARFYRGLLSGQLLRPDLLRTMETTTPAAPGIRAGLGLFSQQLPCGVAWGHRGTIPGYITHAWSSKNGHHQVIASVNIDVDSLSKEGHEALDDLIKTAYCN